MTHQSSGVIHVGEAIRELLTELSRPPCVQWGQWRFDPAALVLRHEETDYEIDLETCTSSASVLDWIFQIHGKTWMTDADRGDLLRAMNVILHPQATLCSGGMDRVHGGLAREYAEAVTTWKSPQIGDCGA